MEHQPAALVQILQILGWVLTLLGQLQIGCRGRAGFATWIAANLVMAGVAVSSGLLWSLGMYATNIASCVWAYWRWGRPSSGDACPQLNTQEELSHATDR